MAHGGNGVIYWEPAWVSSGCSTPWGQGSHQEHAAFFDFNSNVLEGGGMDFYSHDYSGPVGIRILSGLDAFRVYVRPDQRAIVVERKAAWRADHPRLTILAMDGKVVATKLLSTEEVTTETIELPILPAATYVVNVQDGEEFMGSKLVILNKN